MKLINVVFRCVALGMGVSVIVLSILHQMEPEKGIFLLGVGLSSLAISIINQQEKE